MSEEKNMSEEEYLKKHLAEAENKKNPIINSDIPVNNNVNNSRVSDSEFFNYSVEDLPCGQHYPAGTKIAVRPAKTIEIQEYSMVDDNNFYDIVEKMNNMLQSCVRVKYLDGRIGTYLDVKDQDRLSLIFLIRELTFQNGKGLSTKSTCSCKTKNEIELKRENFVFHKLDDKLKKYFDPSNRTYRFELKNNKSYTLTPPTIGVQKAFTDFIIKENSEDKKTNVAFLKIIPFLLDGRNSISYDGIKSKLKEFEEIDDVSFQFLNDAVGKLTFGIKELKKNCTGCGVEIHTPMTFPNGASGVFVVHDAFDLYIKE